MGNTENGREKNETWAHLAAFALNGRKSLKQFNHESSYSQYATLLPLDFPAKSSLFATLSTHFKLRTFCKKKTKMGTCVRCSIRKIRVRLLNIACQTLSYEALHR